MFYYQLAVNFPLRNSVLTYSSEQKLDKGQLVEVPLGRRKEKACVLDEVSVDDIDFDIKGIKPIVGILPNSFVLSSRELELYQWMSQYYHYSLGKLIFDSLPHLLKRPRPTEALQGNNEDLVFDLTAAQKNALAQIRTSGLRGFSRHFLHGVTGAGKTVVYLHLIKEVLAEGRSVLFLLPEINLTPQFVETFQRYLNVPIYSYHSELNNSQKFNLWQQLTECEAPKFILGVRSSIFLPITNLGLIVVDEEHDGSFKQDDRCAYNARDVAIKKASLQNIPVILGSATPSLESFTNFKNRTSFGNYIELRERASQAFFPDVEIVNMREEENKDIWPLSQKGLSALEEAIARKEQALVYINRLGFASYVQCKSCGHQFACPNCSILLKYFKGEHRLVCQSCDYKLALPPMCPECNCLDLMQKGFGTERVEEVLKANLPKARIERFDRDEIKNFKQLEDKLSRFHRGEIDIFVGTQMLSKGHNFRKVNTVLVLGIDSQLNFPDFRAREKTYQTLTQVCGRAGRFGERSRVIVQTMNPNENIFSFIQEHSFSGFFEEEQEIRKTLDFPPYSRMVAIYLSSRFQERVRDDSYRLRSFLESLPSAKNFCIWGPRGNFVEKRANQYTWHLLISSQSVTDLHNAIYLQTQHFKTTTGVQLKLDVDPQTFI